MEREIAELMKLIRQLNTEQQLGVLMMSEGSNIIARNRKNGESLAAFVLNFFDSLA